MAKKIKIPKRFAGAKLPKALRRDLRELAASAAGREALVAALTTVSAAAPKASVAKAKSAGPKSSAAKSPGAKKRKLAAAAAPLEAGPPAEVLKAPELTEASPLATTPPSTSTH